MDRPNEINRPGGFHPNKTSPIERLPVHSQHSEINESPEKKLEVIKERLEYLLAMSEAFLDSSSIYSLEWLKWYLELHEGMTNRVLLELNKLPIFGDIELRKRKKRYIDKVQKH